MAEMETLIALVKRSHRDRCIHMRQRLRAESAALWAIKRQLGWSKYLPETERTRVAKEAKAIMEADEPDEDFEQFVMPVREFAALCQARQDVPESLMESLAPQFPVWDTFVKDVKGFGKIWFTTLIAEAGDLSNYPNAVFPEGHRRAGERKPARYGAAALYKRMGVAPGQGSVPKSLSAEQRKKAWIERKYSPQRRSWMWNVETSIIKAQVRQVKDEKGKDTGERVAIGRYGEIYLREKQKQVAKAEAQGLKIVPAAKIPKGRAAEYVSLGKINNYARKYMGKRLLKDLLRAWRETIPAVVEKPNIALSPAPSLTWSTPSIVEIQPGAC